MCPGVLQFSFHINYFHLWFVIIKKIWLSLKCTPPYLNKTIAYNVLIMDITKIHNWWDCQQFKSNLLLDYEICQVGSNRLQSERHCSIRVITHILLKFLHSCAGKNFTEMPSSYYNSFITNLKIIHMDYLNLLSINI